MDLPLGVEKASDSVVLDGVDPDLLAYVEHLGLIHHLLFMKPLVITSGKDGTHAPGSFHAIGRALDVRTHDKDLEEQLLFMAVLGFSAPSMGIAVFDERAPHDPKHVHLEYHGK